MVKLTLSATPETVRLAKLLAQRRRTTVSALFVRFIAVNAALRGIPQAIRRLCGTRLSAGRRWRSAGAAAVSAKNLTKWSCWRRNYAENTCAEKSHAA